MKDIVGERAVVLFESAGMGSEDFASYSYEVPSVYIMLGAGSKQEDNLYGEPMHNEKVVFNEDILPTGAAIHAYSAIMWLKKINIIKLINPDYLIICISGLFLI